MMTWLAYQAYLAETYVKARASRMWAVARQLLDEAVQRRLLAKNSTEGIRGFKAGHNESPHRARKGKKSMDQQDYTLHFENISPALANSYTEELRNALLKSIPDITVQRQQPHTFAQGPSDTLRLILDSSVITAVATALGRWWWLGRSGSLTVKKTKTGKEMEIKNISGSTKDVIQLLQTFFEDQEEASDENNGDTRSS